MQNCLSVYSGFAKLLDDIFLRKKKVLRFSFSHLHARKKSEPSFTKVGIIFLTFIWGRRNNWSRRKKERHFWFRRETSFPVFFLPLNVMDSQNYKFWESQNYWSPALFSLFASQFNFMSFLKNCMQNTDFFVANYLRGSIKKQPNRFWDAW